MVNLYAVAPTRTVETGESLVRSEAATRVIHLVIKGSVEVTSTLGGARVRLAVVGGGGCIEVSETAARAGDGVIALEPSTVMEIGAPVLDLLSPVTQLALSRRAAAAAAARFDTLRSRHAALEATTAHLAAAALAAGDRSRACLASPSLQSLIAEIPRLPVYAAEIAFKLLDERSRADEVVESIKNDPALAGLVLKRVNSAHYALATRISDYYHAFLMLGVNNVYQLVLESGIESIMPDTDEAREIQTCAHLVSTLSREIAALSGAVPAVVAATIGLLHNVGRSAALIVGQTRPTMGALVAALDPPALGGRVLQSWGLPERVFTVIADQRHPEILPPGRLGHEYAREVAVLHLALACHDLLEGRVPRSPHAQDYLELLGLGGTSPAALYRERIAPALWKNRDCLPARVRRLVEAPLAALGARPA